MTTAVSCGACSSVITETREDGRLQPSATNGVLLHPCGRHGLRRTCHGDAGRGVDDWDGITASAGRRRLVQLQSRVVALKGWRDKCRRSRVEGEGWRDSGWLLRRRRLGRQACQRRALRRGDREPLQVLVISPSSTDTGDDEMQHCFRADLHRCLSTSWE